MGGSTTPSLVKDKQCLCHDGNFNQNLGLLFVINELLFASCAWIPGAIPYCNGAFTLPGSSLVAENA